MKAKLWLCVLALAGLVSTAQFAAQGAAVDYYLKITGIKGELSRGTSPDRIPIKQVDLGVQAPRDVATGMASGKRMHKPITIVKEWGPASPQLHQAMSSGQVLKSVVIEYVRPGPGGKEEVYKTIEMSDVIISSISPAGGGSGGARPTESISFNYQKIEFKDKDGKTMAMDSWVSK